MSPAADRVCELFADFQALNSAISLLNWDRQVLMPAGGAAARTAHVQRLTTLRYKALRSDEMRRALEDLEATTEPGSDEAAMARSLRRELDIFERLPLHLVQEKSRVSSDAYEVWKIAKLESDFSKLCPHLEALFDLAGRQAEALGYKEHIYDPLIDLYEEGATCALATKMFEEIKPPIVALVKEIRERGKPVDDSLLFSDWDAVELRNFAEATLGKIGFDFERGRLDVAPNAFCTHLASTDVRMTTRHSDHIKGIVSSSLHEMGHALYEQGMPQEWNGTPLIGGISLAVHESQSRLWENIIGRSRGFWEFLFPSLRDAFPRLAPLSAHEFWRAFTKVEPTFIRVGADELTYNLHILVRFELEVEILTGVIRVKDIPEAWNSKYKAYLGITPPNDALGCLQDVHWSRGSIGYFPTYAMGNLIGAQIWRTLTGQIPNTDALMAEGEFAPILGWLQERVYRQGKRYVPNELVRRVTDSPMQATAWLDYARTKYADVYDL